MKLGFPTFVPVTDPEMGFEKIVKIAHALGGKSQTSFSNSLSPIQILNCKLTLIDTPFLFSMQAARHYLKTEE